MSASLSLIVVLPAEIQCRRSNEAEWTHCSVLYCEMFSVAVRSGLVHDRGQGPAEISDLELATNIWENKGESGS